MTVEAMRCRISEVYESNRWRMRVRMMPDNQVIAIYRNMLERGLFERKNRRKSKIRYQQISMFD